MFTGSGSSGRAFWGAFRVGRLVFGLEVSVCSARRFSKDFCRFFFDFFDIMSAI